MACATAPGTYNPYKCGRSQNILHLRHQKHVEIFNTTVTNDDYVDTSSMQGLQATGRHRKVKCRRTMNAQYIAMTSQATFEW